MPVVGYKPAATSAGPLHNAKTMAIVAGMKSNQGSVSATNAMRRRPLVHLSFPRSKPLHNREYCLFGLVLNGLVLLAR